MKNPTKLRVLVACECSGRVREEFRKLGHDAWSCDLKEAEDGSPFHITGDALEAIKTGSPEGGLPWDLVIAHPPCTDLAVCGARWFHKKQAAQAAALDFVRALLGCSVTHLALENPVGIIPKHIRKWDQVVQPYWFGDEAQKKTCLWLNDLPPLSLPRTW